jgi:hypothetical protein
LQIKRREFIAGRGGVAVGARAQHYMRIWRIGAVMSFDDGGDRIIVGFAAGDAAWGEIQ